MQKALNYLIGEHDFSSFKSSGTLNPSTVCNIELAECKKTGDKVIIDIAGNRFLYNMVRIMVGTLIFISEGKIASGELRDVILSKNRIRAGRTAPPQGLYLNKINY